MRKKATTESFFQKEFGKNPKKNDPKGKSEERYEKKPDGYKGRKSEEASGKKYNADKPYASRDNKAGRSERFGKSGQGSGYKKREEGDYKKRRDDEGGFKPRKFDRDRKDSFPGNKDGDYKKPFKREEGKSERRFDKKPPFKKSYPAREEGDATARPRRYNDRDANDGQSRERKPPFKKSYPAQEEGDATVKSRRYNDRDGNDEQPRERKTGFKKPFKTNNSGDKEYRSNRPGKEDRRTYEDRPYRRRADEGDMHEERPSYRRRYEEEEELELPVEQMPLNKYIAHGGLCGRREAAELVKQGKVKVNGELVTEPGHKIQPGDQVSVSGKRIVPQKGLVYILLNKPKDFITTTKDEKGRRTVMQLVSNSGVDRLFPVGRLDRNTTGLIIMTNDGEFAQKLSHPRYSVKKVYQVTLDKPLTQADFDKVLEGVTLDDGKAPVDSLAYLEEKNEVGLEIHSGRNRIVRRIFESLGYVVEKLDRVMYAGLTKKNLPRGKWRFLSEHEIVLLKHFKV